MRRTFTAIILLAVALISGPVLAADKPADVAAKLTQEISPDDARLFYGGRWDRQDPKSPVCEWPACSVTVHFSGTALGMKLKGNQTVYWDVDVDGKSQGKLADVVQNGVTVVAANLPAGEHTVTLAKRTEPFFGAGVVQAVLLEAEGKLLPAPAPKHRIMVIGDSITCGYGVEVKSSDEPFSGESENACQAYGALVARRFGAEYIAIAWSGRKMAGDNTMAEIYDRTRPSQEGKWDEASKPVDVILINLSTNDFGKGVPDEEDWVRAYKNFVIRLHKLHPKARVYCLTSPMLSDMFPPNRKAATTLRGYLERIMKDVNNTDEVAYVRFIEIPTQDWKNGYGADYHPSLATHWDMAEMIVARISKDLNWEASPAAPRPPVAKRTKLPQEETPPGKYIAWDGDARDVGSGWSAPQVANVSVKKSATETHDGKPALLFHVEEMGAYTGMGWNFFGYWPQDGSIDSTQYKDLSFWVKVKSNGEGPNLLNVQLNCSATKKPSNNVQIPKYCKNYNDGEWHQVIIPLKDLEKKNFDPKTVWEINIGQWSPNERSFDVYVADIELLGDASGGKTTAPTP